MSHVSNDPVVSKLSRVARFFANDVAQFKQSLSQLDAEIGPEAIPQHHDDFHRRVLGAFQQSQDACRHFEAENGDDPILIQEIQKGFRQETDLWFRRSWYGNQARTKPNGFVGDCETLVNLYEYEAPARGLGGYLDLCIVDLPLGHAVRARLAALREFMIREIPARQADVRVLNIACGPCREFRDWPAPGHQQKVEVVALDNDPKALAYVQRDVVPHLNGSTKLNPVRYNALRTRSASATERNFGRFDIIYSIGLCDYLSDEHLIRMLAAWREILNDDGVLYVAFKDALQYDKTPCQWHLDWFFFQRTHQDVINLYAAAGFDVDAIETTRDSSGIIINVISRRTRRKITRIDLHSSVAGRPKQAAVNNPARGK